MDSRPRVKGLHFPSKTLKKTKFSEDMKSSVCGVCQLDLSKEKECCRLNCGHLFHYSCIAKWLRKTAQCPLCRVVVS